MWQKPSGGSEEEEDHEGSSKRKPNPHLESSVVLRNFTVVEEK